MTEKGLLGTEKDFINMISQFTYDFWHYNKILTPKMQNVKKGSWHMPGFLLLDYIYIFFYYLFLILA